MSMRRVHAVMGVLTGVAAAIVLSAFGPPAGAQQDESGYWTLDAAGTVQRFGDAEHLGHKRGVPSIDIEATPSGRGYYVLQPDGTVWEFGDAAVLAEEVPAPAAGDAWTAITSTPTGRGYWVFSARGCVAALGDAVDHDSMCGRPLNAPVVGSAVTPGGDGYWMVARDGGVFSFGDAAFHGSTGNMRLNKPVTGMAPAPGGNGYWLVAEDGGIFTFGAGLPFYGSMGGQHLNAPVVGMVTSPTGGGYLMVASDGGIFAFGDVPFRGSLGDNPPPAPVVSVTPLPRPNPGPVQPVVELRRINPETVTVGDTWGYTGSVLAGQVDSLAINFRRPNGQASLDLLTRLPDGTWEVRLTVGGSWMAGSYDVTGITVNGQTTTLPGAEALGFTIAVAAPPPPPGEVVVEVTRIHGETVAVGDTWGYTATVVQGQVGSLAINFRRPDGQVDDDPLHLRADGLWQVRQTVRDSWPKGPYEVTGITVDGQVLPLAGAEALGFTVAGQEG